MHFNYIFDAVNSIFGKGKRVGVQKLRFWLALFWNWRCFCSLISKNAPRSWINTINIRPESLGVLIWPYVNNTWGLEQRVSTLISHHSIVDHLPSIDVRLDQAITILRLDDIFLGLSIVLDRPKWFMREGELSLNLFVGEERVYSIAFCFVDRLNSRAAYIGGIQGRSLAEITQLYHDLTKAMHGCRPRDFLIHVFFEFCRSNSIYLVYAVSEAYRHHRHPYFGKSHKSSNSSNYDDIWTDRGGEAAAAGFFTFSLKEGNRKNIADIPTKKRAMYRRRYDFLDQISVKVASKVKSLNSK